jgi:hypothetical protein
LGRYLVTSHGLVIARRARTPSFTHIRQFA